MASAPMRRRLVDDCLPAADASEVDPHGELADNKELRVGQQHHGAGVAEQANAIVSRVVGVDATSVEELAHQANCWMIMAAKALRDRNELPPFAIQ